jgi:hypothetical protein
MSSSTRTHDLSLLRSTTDNPTNISSEWLDSFRREHGYKCGHFDNSIHPDEIVCNSIDTSALGFTAILAIDTISQDLYDVLKKGWHHSTVVGRLTTTMGISSTQLSLSARPLVQLRGDKRSYCWRCKVCHQLIYTPLGRAYILSADANYEAIRVSTHGVIVPHKYLKLLKSHRWIGTKCEPLTVEQSPLDGFPSVIDEIEPSKERRPKWLKRGL